VINSIQGGPNVNSVKEIYDRYHESIITKPNRYRLGHGGIQIYLPLDLCEEFNNKCSGGNGYLSDGSVRPGGIRLEPGQVKKLYGDNVTALKQIFSSEQSLYDFIYERGGYTKRKNIRVGAIKNRIMTHEHSVPLNLLIKNLLDLAIKTNDNELAKMVLSNTSEKFLKKIKVTTV
tara:strand:- start:533 stop:1057 length:525 start_codon:yes stop_codon:yes gene_type:complete